MKLRSVYLFILFSLFSINKLKSQNLNGTWEGMMNQELLQINIVQKNDELCGYTYDHFYQDKRNYCKAYFKGHYDNKQQAWLLSGISFIENSGTHVLMNIKLWTVVENENSLEASVGIKSGIGSILTLGSKEFVMLKRISNYTVKLPNNMPPCFPDEKRSTEPDPRDRKQTEPDPRDKKQTVPEVIKVLPKKPADSIKTPPVTIIKPVDTPRAPVVIKNETSQQLQKMIVRKNTTISRIPVSVKNITLNVYDNATVDGDSVTIFYNGKILVNKQRLSEKPIVINLELDEKAALHEITMFAENLGSIPPNTALIVVNVDDKRYELHSSTNLAENAVLIFEYKPK